MSAISLRDYVSTGHITTETYELLRLAAPVGTQFVVSDTPDSPIARFRVWARFPKSGRSFGKHSATVVEATWSLLDKLRGDSL